MPKLLSVVVLLSLCLALLAAPVYAAEETGSAPAAADAPPGLSTLVLLLGLGAVSVVGVVILARDNFQDKPDES